MTRSWAFWLKVFIVEGVFLFALSMGWAMGSIWKAEALVVYSLFGAGSMSILVGTILYKWWSDRSKEVNEEGASAPVSLDNAFRAFRAFGTQAPLWNKERLRSEVFSTDTSLRWTVSRNELIVFELLSGPDVLLNFDGEEIRLSEGELCRLGPSLSPVGLGIKSEGSERQNSEGLIHFISDSTELG